MPMGAFLTLVTMFLVDGLVIRALYRHHMRILKGAITPWIPSLTTTFLFSGGRGFPDEQSKEQREAARSRLGPGDVLAADQLTLVLRHGRHFAFQTIVCVFVSAAICGLGGRTISVVFFGAK
jgi:hypothetical protein